MVLFPNAKINLGLHIGPKREDGYHAIRSVFYPIPWCDVLELLPGKGNGLQLHLSGMAIEGDPQHNLVARAFDLMQREYGCRGVQAWLHKNIPTGAGLGGGSADAAFMLRAMADLFALDLSPEVLKSLAASLGSDCSFFIDNQPALAQGRGEVLSPCACPLSGYYLAVVHPGAHVPTAWAYQAASPRAALPEPAHALPSDLQAWKDHVVNDFEAVVFARWPEVAALKEAFYARGARYAAMSGSGSAVFGLFEEGPDLSAFNRPGYRVFSAQLP